METAGEMGEVAVPGDGKQWPCGQVVLAGPLLTALPVHKVDLYFSRL